MYISVVGVGRRVVVGRLAHLSYSLSGDRRLVGAQTAPSLHFGAGPVRRGKDLASSRTDRTHFRVIGGSPGCCEQLSFMPSPGWVGRRLSSFVVGGTHFRVIGHSGTHFRVSGHAGTHFRVIGQSWTCIGRYEKYIYKRKVFCRRAADGS